jgi:hypothetical protein
MTPAALGKKKRDLPDLRSLGVHQSVILAADDEPLIRNLVTLLMQQKGYFVLSSADDWFIIARRRRRTTQDRVGPTNIPASRSETRNSSFRTVAAES